MFHTLHTNRYDLLVFYIVDIVDVSTPHFSTYSDDVWIMSGSLLLYCAAAASLFTTGMCGKRVNAQKKFTGVTKAVILMSDQQTVGLPRHLRAHSLPLQHFNGVAYRHPCPLHSFPSCACFYLFAQKNTREAQTGGFSLRPSNFGPSESSEQEVCSCLSREGRPVSLYCLFCVNHRKLTNKRPLH